MARNPTHIALSTCLAEKLVWEHLGDDLSNKSPAWKKAIDSTFMGLKVLGRE